VFVSPPGLQLPLDHRQPGGILATIRHKNEALPRENEVANVEAVFNVLKTLPSSRLLRSSSFWRL
jgi:hypothetical protein